MIKIDDKPQITGKQRRALRNQAIRERFTVLYEQERIRIDDTLVKLSEEFFLSPEYIYRLVNQ